MELNSNLSIKTTRLMLKPIHEDYIDDIHANFTPKVTRYMPHNPKGDRIDTVNFVERSKEQLIAKTDLIFVMLDQEEQFIGCCGITHINPISVEIGLWLKEEAQNQGFGTDAVIGLIKFIEQYFSIEYIIYPVDSENIRSRNIPEKLGFTAFKTYSQQKNERITLNIIEYRKYYARNII